MCTKVVHLCVPKHRAVFFIKYHFFSYFSDMNGVGQLKGRDGIELRVGLSFEISLNSSLRRNANELNQFDQVFTFNQRSLGDRQ